MMLTRPSVSVVVPVFREGERVRVVLETILRQTISSNSLEVLVVSPEENQVEREICCEYADILRAKYLVSDSQGRAQGLNYAIRRSVGDFICRIDGRSIVPDDYIARMLKTATEKDAAVVGGVQRALLHGDSPWQDAIAMCMNSPCGAGPSPHRTARRSGPTDAVYLGLYRRELFEQVGWFDEKSAVISEEVDFYVRVRASGGVVWLDADLIIGYTPRASLINQFKLYFRYGGAKVAIAQKYKTLINLRQLVAPGFYGVIGILITVAPFWIYATNTLALLVGGYVAAVSICAFRESALVHNLSLWPKGVITMMAMHAGYALGYWRKIFFKDLPGTYWPG